MPSKGLADSESNRGQISVVEVNQAVFDHDFPNTFHENIGYDHVYARKKEGRREGGREGGREGWRLENGDWGLGAVFGCWGLGVGGWGAKPPFHMIYTCPLKLISTCASRC